MTKKTLLLAENDADLMQSTYTELKDSVNMSIIQASDGTQAFQKTRNQTFDVILTNSLKLVSLPVDKLIAEPSFILSIVEVTPSTQSSI